MEREVQLRGPLGISRSLLCGAAVGLLLALLVEVVRVAFGPNVHVLLPGRVYRSALLSADRLEEVVRRYGIRTVVNLRGCCDPMPWYLDECRVTHRLGIAQEDVCLSAGREPSACEMLRLLEILDRTEYPILIHCRRGADRTGLVAAVIVLLETNGGLDAARRQLGLRYGHVALGRPANLDEYLEGYGRWLVEHGWGHSPERLRQWLGGADGAATYRCEVTPLDVPAVVPCGRPAGLRMRFRNTGSATWHLRPGKNAGYHPGYQLFDPAGAELVSERAGLFVAEVAPGASLDVTLDLPPLERPGRYRLLVDMVKELYCWFYQTGSEPLEIVLNVG